MSFWQDRVAPFIDNARTALVRTPVEAAIGLFMACVFSYGVHESSSSAGRLVITIMLCCYLALVASFGVSALHAFRAVDSRIRWTLNAAFIAAIAVYGSQRSWIDDAETRARAAAAYDRCFDPAGVARQLRAVMADGSRAAGLATVTVPTLVLHGSRDALIHPSGGRRTAELVPGARYVEIDGLGHDYPPPVWDRWVRIWADFVADLDGGER